MDRRVERVILLMKRDLNKELSMSNLAQCVNLSPSHLHALFKIQVGVSPMHYLRILRMQQAKRLLETSFLSVKEIMVKVGLKDESHFIRGFKKAYGLTPGRYREMLRPPPH